MAASSWVSRAAAGGRTVPFVSLGSCTSASRVVTSCLGTTSPSQIILTAKRPFDNSAVARILGPGCQLPGFGRILGLEEFFGHVNRRGLLGLDESIFQETLMYYMGAENKDYTIPVHGVQLYFKSELEKRSGIIIHAREEFDLDVTFAKGTKGDEGAKVRLLTGSFGDRSAGIPLDDFTTLDVSMRPDSDAVFPISCSYGIVVYILEGAAVLKHNRFSDEPTYQNEGHGLWIPPHPSASKPETMLTVTTHPSSHLRFLLLAANA